MTETLDSLDYFVMLMVDDNNRHGLLDYTIPKESAQLDMFRYSSIKLCPKLIYDVTLTNPADYEHGAFGMLFFNCLSRSSFFSITVHSRYLTLCGTPFVQMIQKFRLDQSRLK